MRAFIFVVLLCLGSLAFAQQPTQDQIKEAQKISDKGSELYAKKEYALAAVEFERANEIYPDSSFLFNASMSYYKCDNYEAAQKALELFQQFAKLYPNAPKEQLDNAKKKIGEIIVKYPKKESQAQPTTSVTAQTPVVDSAVKDEQPFCRQKKTLCWVAAGSAASLAAVGSVYWLRFGIPSTEGGTNGAK